MLEKDPSKRITIDEIIHHTWVTSNMRCPIQVESGDIFELESENLQGLKFAESSKNIKINMLKK